MSGHHHNTDDAALSRRLLLVGGASAVAALPTLVSRSELALPPAGVRLTTPLKRVSGAKGDPSSRFEPVSWDEALDVVAAKFLVSA